MVPGSNAIGYPRAVVVEAGYAALALSAMSASQRSACEAVDAEVDAVQSAFVCQLMDERTTSCLRLG